MVEGIINDREGLNCDESLLSVLKEDGQYSFTRLVSLTLIVVFLIASFYLILRGSTWGNYDSFATFCGGGGAATRV